MQNGKIRELGRDASPKVTVNIFPLGESLPTSLTLGCQLQARDISRRNHTFCATVRQVRRCPRWNKVHDEHRRVWINSWWRSLAGRPRSVAGQRNDGLIQNNGTSELIFRVAWSTINQRRYMIITYIAYTTLIYQKNLVNVTGVEWEHPFSSEITKFRKEGRGGEKWNE